MYIIFTIYLHYSIPAHNSARDEEVFVCRRSSREEVDEWKAVVALSCIRRCEDDLESKAFEEKSKPTASYLSQHNVHANISATPRELRCP